MSKKSVLALVITGSMFAASSAWADHNSIWGEGWANMPNDIHNSAIEDDQDTFMDLVQYGGGADSVNRYADTTDTATMSGGSMSGSTTVSRGSGMGQGGRR